MPYKYYVARLLTSDGSVYQPPRSVYVNHKLQGKTGERGSVGEPGDYLFELGGAQDFEPPSQECPVTGTPIAPTEVVFVQAAERSRSLATSSARPAKRRTSKRKTTKKKVKKQAKRAKKKTTKATKKKSKRRQKSS